MAKARMTRMSGVEVDGNGNERHGSGRPRARRAGKAIKSKTAMTSKIAGDGEQRQDCSAPAGNDVKHR